MPARKTADRPLRIAYLSLQAVEQGQDSWAAVLEIVRGMVEAGAAVDEWFVRYPHGTPGPLGRLRAMRRLQRKLAERLDDYDAVYVRAHPFAGPLSSAARRAGVPVVQECNGSYEDLFIAWPRARLFRRAIESAQRRQYAEASAVIAVTPQLAAWVESQTGRGDVVVSGNGANVDVFRPDAPRRAGLPAPYVAFFGQFAPWQGIRVLLDAVRQPAWPREIALVLAGDGVMRPEVEAAAAANEPPRVVYLGRLPYEEVAGVVAGVMAAAVPMYDPERAETGLSPLKLFEAMACGVPVIASDTPGIAEVVREAECGVLVTPGDAAAFAAAVASLRSDPRAAAMGARGRRAAVESYSWPARARQRMRVLEEVVANAAPRRRRP